MPALATARAANALFAPTYLPTAVFVGGTSGVGQAMAEAFARYTKGNANIVICGRNRAAAESIIASFPKPAPDSGAQHQFVECDAMLMKNIAHTASDLVARLPRINYLVISAGLLNFRGRDETTEGIDKRLALHYYARWKFTHDLLPLLRKAKEEGQDAKMMSVLAAGGGGKIDLDDLGLKKHYSLVASGLTSPTYNDLMIESFAEQNPGISFVHAWPGTVRTPLLKAGHWLLKPLIPLVMCAVYPISVSAPECAEYLLWGLLDAQPGASRRNNKGDDIGRARYYGSDDARARLWEHTVDEMKRTGAQ